ncbi:MAG: NUDIX hydrolase [Candidatus Cloacimonetes bacterium]|nr:NUDIX hydrolase [Candidatus Cloacimonadota bacterium]
MKRFRIIHRGLFATGDFEIELLPGKKSYPADVKKLINCAWQEARLNPDTRLYNGRVLSYIGSEIKPSPDGRAILRLSLQETDYKSFFGTNVQNANLIADPASLANALAVCALVETFDATVVIGKRSNTLAEGKGLWHVPGGTLELKTQWKDQLPLMKQLGLGSRKISTLNPILTMLRELKEELNLEYGDFIFCHCLGLGENLGMKKPEILCHFKTKLSSQELSARTTEAIDCSEHSEILFVPVEDLRDFICMNPFAPIGEAAISLYLERFET